MSSSIIDRENISEYDDFNSGCAVFNGCPAFIRLDARSNPVDTHLLLLVIIDFIGGSVLHTRLRSRSPER